MTGTLGTDEKTMKPLGNVISLNVSLVRGKEKETPMAQEDEETDNPMNVYGIGKIILDENTYVTGTGMVSDVSKWEVTSMNSCLLYTSRCV